MRVFFKVMLILVALTGCSSDFIPQPTATRIPIADNFFFVYTNFGCGLIPFNILDTKSRTLIHTPISETDSITLPFPLAETELAKVYDKMIEIDFFNYPTDFIIPPGYVAVTEVPVSSYSISATNADKIHYMNWVGASSHTEYPKADQLLDLIWLIEEIIHNHPEYQKLHPPTAGCA